MSGPVKLGVETHPMGAVKAQHGQLTAEGLCTADGRPWCVRLRSVSREGRVWSVLVPVESLRGLARMVTSWGVPARPPTRRRGAVDRGVDRSQARRAKTPSNEGQSTGLGIRPGLEGGES